MKLTLRKKVLFYSGTTLLALFCVFFSIGISIVMKGFWEVEKENAENNLKRAAAALNESIHSLHLKASDWASWDDTFAFINGTLPEYPGKNFVPVSMQNMELNIIAVFDSQKNLLAGIRTDASLQPLPLPDSLSREMQSGNVIGNKLDGKTSYAGALRLPEGVLLMSLRPVLPTSMEGESNGYFIFGRFITDELIHKLRLNTRLKISLLTDQSVGIARELTPRQMHDLKNDLPVLIPISSNKLLAYTLIRDIAGQPLFYLRADLERRIYKTAYQSLLYFTGAMMFCGFLTLMILMKVLDKTLLERVTLLSHFLQSIGKQKSISDRIAVKGNDELSSLTASVNHMLENIEDFQAKKERQEAILRQSEKMAAIGQLVGGVAHEINNPLAVILGFSQSALQCVKTSDPLYMHVSSIEREALRCKNMVQDLLTFSRINRGEKEALDLSEAIESGLNLIMAQSRFKMITVEKHFNPIPKIFANRNQIQQIVINLATNAIDAMSQGGILTLAVERITVDKLSYVQLSVSDTGGGIPKEIQGRIFEPFFTTKDVGKGTGLGLSLVYELIQKHNGKISFDSIEGKGTCFRVLLPAL